jgi:hypothetical protein
MLMQQVLAKSQEPKAKGVLASKREKAPTGLTVVIAWLWLTVEAWNA